MQDQKSDNGGCCRSFHTRNCCIATSFFGAIFTILGILIVFFGSNLIFEAMLKTMALHKHSESFSSWLVPPVEEHLEVYAFSVTNPEEVAQRGKPKLVEIGPFVYKVVTIKDTRDNLVFNDDEETLTYRPRKFYYFDREKSVGDPDTMLITVPNIPFWTGIHNLQAEKSGFMWGIKAGVIQSNGPSTPFVTLSFSGLLWGYEDVLPCIGARLERPEDCTEEGKKTSSLDNDDDFDMDMDMDDIDMDWRKKRSVEEDENICLECTEKWPENYEKMVRPQAEYVNCSCQWGFFRDMNVSLREPVRMYHGISDISKKGWVKEFDGKDTMGWWKEGSQCDKDGGQDGGTFPPNIYTEDSVIEIFMGPMCRKIKLHYVEKKNLAGIMALRFVPNANYFGSHKDYSPLGNRDNECFCMEDEGFTCFPSGLYDLGPCKKSQRHYVGLPGPLGVPLALSAPHFYQADPIFRDQVEGMTPVKEKHQFYMDIEPELGIPLAKQSRFQLNLVLRSNPNIPAITNFPEQVVVPFLWVQDGYSEPSQDMAQVVIGFGAPGKVAKLGGIAFVAIGAIMLLSSLSWFMWSRCTKSNTNDRAEHIKLRGLKGS